jgi:hypothetical protein
MLYLAWQRPKWPKLVLKTRYRSIPFQQEQLYEDRSFGTGVIRGRKTANNIAVKDIKGLLINNETCC